MTHRAATKAAARRRDKRAAKASDELEELLADVVAKQTRTLVRQFTATAQTLAAATFATGGDPAPPVPTGELWNQQQWDDTLTEAETHITTFVVNEMETDFGIRVASEQPFVQGLTARLVAAIEDWTLDFKNLVSRVIDEGHRQLKSVDQVADDLQAAGVRTRKQANAVARTQMVSASNAANYKGSSAFAGPGDTKKWVATPDSRTRRAHMKADGQTVPFDEPFIVDGERGMHPGDSAFSAQNLVNCRCTFLWIPNDNPPDVVPATKPPEPKPVGAEQYGYMQWSASAAEKRLGDGVRMVGELHGARPRTKPVEMQWATGGDLKGGHFSPKARSAKPRRPNRRTATPADMEAFRRRLAEWRQQVPQPQIRVIKRKGDPDGAELVSLWHEMGHWQDYDFEAGHWVSQVARTHTAKTPEMEAMVRFLDAAFESDEIQAIGKAKFPLKYKSYLRDPREVWARAYAQYVTTKTGHKGAKAGIRKWREDVTGMHWTDSEFRRLLPLVEDVLRAQGVLS